MLKRNYAGKLEITLVGLCILSLLAACGQKEDIESTNLRIGKEGNIVSTIVEDFDKTYYTIEGLEAMIQEEASSYNTKKADAITLESLEIPENMEGKILVTMNFASAEDYTSFNGEELFYGTIAQAKTAGYKIPDRLVSTSDLTKTIGSEEIAALENNHVLIIAENTTVILPKKAVYITEGNEVINNKKINVVNTDGLNYVIME